jgi:dTDP-glucose 4,6-dehydratase
MKSSVTILITGGAGFIGSRYAGMIAEDHPDWSIRVLDMLTYSGTRANLEGLEGRLSFIEGDIADSTVVDVAMRGCRFVVNFAAESHVDRSLIDSRPFIHTNVEGVKVLLDAAVRWGVDRFLQVSTDEVYGDLPAWARGSVESDRMDPSSPYAASKATAEHLVNAAHCTHDLHTLMTRGSNTYGHRQYPEKIIPLFITNALEGRAMPIYGDGSAVRDYLHVDDHCRGIDRVLRQGQPGSVYNLGAGLEISAARVAHAICGVLDLDASVIQYVQDRPAHDMRYSVDSGKAESLGWTQAWSFDQGLRRTVQWYVDHTSWWKPIRQSDDFKAWELTWYAETGRTGP